MTDFVPTLFKTLVRALQGGQISAQRLESLQFVLVGGEEIDAPSVHGFRQLLPHAKVINTYGHTEASIGMVFHQVVDADGLDIPLGSPIQNTFVKVVDEDLLPVPPGQVGEIVVAGICVGAGYLHAHELNGKAFISNPFRDLPGEKVYRTGDLGYVDVEGHLRYAGRKDDQLKIRGVRVEAGEIGKALLECHPGALDCLALVVRDQREEPALVVAYTGAGIESPERLRQAMATRLPDSHLPSAFFHFNAFPTSNNGKTDRGRVAADVRALLCKPKQEMSGNVFLDSIVACFSEILHGTDVLPQTDFFRCGADSLDAVNLCLTLQQRLGVPVRAGMVFQHPTPEALSKAILSEASAQGISAPPVPSVRFSNPASPRSASSAILLTGATGFVGVHLLEQLLTRSGARVFALVRAREGESATHRLHTSLSAAFPGASIDRGRIAVLKGDLALPGLGLDAGVAASLAKEVDDIVHCGAEVNFLRGATQLFHSNVQATVELIRLCDMGRGKRLHYVSSVAAITASSRPDGALANGYGYTKHLSEQVISEAVAQGLHARVYRLDEVLPSGRTGSSNPKSMVDLFIASCLHHRVNPRGVGQIGLLPVDKVAAWFADAIVGRGTERPLPPCVTLKAQRFMDISELLDEIALLQDCSLRSISYQEFLARLGCATDRNSKMLRSILPALKNEPVHLFNEAGDSDVKNSEDRVVRLDGTPSDLRAFAARLLEEPISC